MDYYNYFVELISPSITGPVIVDPPGSDTGIVEPPYNDDGYEGRTDIFLPPFDPPIQPPPPEIPKTNAER